MFVRMPSNLLQTPCGAIKAGETVRSLAKGYVVNTGCVFDYELLLKKQNKWQDEQKELFKDGK